jgi:polar amino acid transport system substrate-binding protein
MKFLSRVAAATTILAISMGAAQAQDKEWTKVRIGVDATYPPFESVDASGQIVGFSVEIANALCERMEVECEFINQDWEGIIPALQANRFDAIISSMSITDERKEQVAFTNKYYNTPPAVVVPKDSPLTGVTPEELGDITIGAQNSTIHANYIQEILPEAELRAYPSPDEYKLDLVNGRLDAAIDDSTVIDTWLKTEEGAACCKRLGLVEQVPRIHGEGAGIAIRKEDTALVEMFNKALEEIRADGTYKAINDKYFSFDAYGS